jgi:hypothetical protein
MIKFDELVTELRKVASPGRCTVVSYAGLKFMLDCGIEVWDYAETMTLQRLIADIGTPEQKLRLQQEIIAGRWSTEIFLAERESATNIERNSDS